MAFDNRTTYLCYNNKDLIRDGFIPVIINKSYRSDNYPKDPVDNFNFSRLKNPPKGVSYSVVRKEDDLNVIVEVIEKKKLLPAEKLQIEIDFSKTMKSAVSHPIPPGPLVPGVVGGLVGNLGMGAIGFGGISTGLTEITYQALESQTFINKKVQITQEILDTSIIQFNGFPLSVFGIVKEHIENFGNDGGEEADAYKKAHPQAQIITNESGEIEARIGLDFVNDQLDSLGKFSEGIFSGVGRKRISGATDSDGLFGGVSNAYLRIVENSGDSGEGEEREVVLIDGQKQIFVKIVSDGRVLKFRGDNKEAVGGGVYPFQIRGEDRIDATNKQIRIDTTDLSVDDYIYITFNTTIGDRYLRQNIEHKGSVAQGNTVGIAGFTGSIRSVQDIFDYRIETWKVPPLPNGVTMSNIDEVTDGYTKDDDYKLTLNEFIEIDTKQRTNSNFKLTGDEASEIEGWRLSEAILWRRIDNFFAADYRGILYIGNTGAEVDVLYPRSSIRDQEWFTTYLESLDFTYPTGDPDPNDPIDENGSPKLTYLPSDLEKKIEENINFEDMEGFLFDISEIVNSLLFDREKIHYYRPFANALKTVSSYNSGDKTKGIGIPHLDLLPLICSSVSTTTKTETIDGELVARKQHSYKKFNLSACSTINLEYYDLSYSIFDHVNATFSKNQSCEDSFNLRNYNYWSENYDAQNEGPGAWYSSGVLDLSVMEWYPDGLQMDSFWKIETPLFCDNFSSNTRVYIEKMGGNSLDNFSWIYVDTEPFVPNNISADSNSNYSKSIIVFSEEEVNNGLCYHQLNDNFFENQLSLLKVDKTKNHNRDTYSHSVDGKNVIEAYDHDKNLINGQNRILGDFPSYSHGIPISEEIFRVCSLKCTPDSPLSLDFWWTRDLLKDLWPNGESFELNFNEDPPRVNIPSVWCVKYLEVEFSYMNQKPTNIEKYVSFYFEDKESSISNFVISELVPKDDHFLVRFKFRYYFGGSFQFLGKFWSLVNIISVKGRFCFGNNPSFNPWYNIDTYKINSGQSAVSYDRQGRILVFYANNTTGNLDIAVSYDDGDTWGYDRNIIRLISGETATLPFAIKDNNTRFIHLFYVLNDKFVMYKKIDTDLIDKFNGLVEYSVPETYEAGDYDLTVDNPEKAYWGDYSSNGIKLRSEPSYFVIGDGGDNYFLEQISISKAIDTFNNSLSGTDNSKKTQANRFLFSGSVSEMKDSFNGSPYAVYIAEDGVFRIFFVSNNRLSIKSSYDFISWKYDIIEQSIHRNYIDEELNKGFTEDISNIQIVRDDYNKSIVSVLYFHNQMLFIRHFQTNLLFSRYDPEGNLQNSDMVRHLEITDVDTTVSPSKKRTTNIPIFLVGIIPDTIKNTIKKDIEDKVPTNKSDLAIYFPYKDPDSPTDIDANKAMVDLFNENFRVDINTQVYAVTSSTGLIRVFYKDSIGNIDGIVIDSLMNPKLEVMNVFSGV